MLLLRTLSTLVLVRMDLQEARDPTIQHIKTNQLQIYLTKSKAIQKTKATHRSQIQPHPSHLRRSHILSQQSIIRFTKFQFLWGNIRLHVFGEVAVRPTEVLQQIQTSFSVVVFEDSGGQREI